MHPQHRRPPAHRQGTDGSSAPQPRPRAGFAEHGADEALAGGPHQQGEAGGRELPQAPQKREVVLGGFGKAQPRIPDDPLRPHPGGEGLRRGGLQLLPHLAHHIAVHRQAIHRAAIAPAVGHHIGATSGGDQGQHRRIPQAAARRRGGGVGAAHIVDPLGARRQGRLSDRRMKGVDRQHSLGPGGADRRQGRPQALPFPRGTHLQRPRPGALGAEIQHGRPLPQQPSRLPHRRLHRLQPPPIAEGIRREVEHAHHGGGPFRAQRRRPHGRREGGGQGAGNGRSRL